MVFPSGPVLPRRSVSALLLPLLSLVAAAVCACDGAHAGLPGDGFVPVVDEPTEAVPTPPGIAANEVKDWQLTWRDEFSGPELDLSKWTYRSTGPRESAMISPECVTLDGAGRLQLWVTEKDGVLHNGMIGSQKKFEATFGIFAARIRFPRQEGQHGAFWMQPGRSEKVTDDAASTGAEIDIIEWFGAGRKDGGTAANVYWPSAVAGKPHRAGQMVDMHRLLAPGETWSDAFHIYSVEWSPEGYIFRVDGHEMQRINEGISHQPQYLILSLLTSDWEAPRLNRSKLPNSMDVDWVRVWQKPEATAPDVPTQR